MAAERQRRAIEWPTVALASAIYSGWLGLTWFATALPWPIVFVAGAWLVAWHASLQHELIHGHPTRWPAINRLIGLPSLILFLPFDRYRAIHLTHHRDEHITDPLEDPETMYWTAERWRGLGPTGRLVVRVTARLAGRLVVGPVWVIVRFLIRDARLLRRGEPKVWDAWIAHTVATAPVAVWAFGVCGIPVFQYLGCFVVPGMALMLLRSFAEHRAHDEADRRTAIVERAPVLGALFLFNNLHLAHHERPGLAWYRLPAFYAAERERLLRKNGGLVYDGYGEIVRRFLFRAHDASVHPKFGGNQGSRTPAGSITNPYSAADATSHAATLPA